jgi:hypothetical protein
MGPELIVLAALAGLGGIGGIASVAEMRSRRRYVARVRAEWVRAGRIVHYGPIGATCYGRRPHSVYNTSDGSFGALGLVDSKLVFVGRGSVAYTAILPFEAIRWAGTRLITVSGGRSPSETRALIIHYDGPDGWYVYTFAGKQIYPFSEALEQIAGLTVHQPAFEREDYGPAHVTRLNQDIYGQWTLDRRGELYLAPDRLLFDWHGPILLSQFRQADVYSKGGLNELNPFAEELLRIEYEDADGEPHTVGFQVRHADKWADFIAQRTQLPVEYHTGRKKKEED